MFGASPATDRREFLAAAPALAALTAGPAVAVTAATSPHRAPWDAAMDRYRDADATYRRFHDVVYDPLAQLEKEFREKHGIDWGEPGWHARERAVEAVHGTAYKVPDHIVDELERLSDALSATETALLALPSPDLAALRWKLDKVFRPDDADEFTDSWARHYVAQTIADYQRLLGEEA